MKEAVTLLLLLEDYDWCKPTVCKNCKSNYANRGFTNMGDLHIHYTRELINSLVIFYSLGIKNEFK